MQAYREESFVSCSLAEVVLFDRSKSDVFVFIGEPFCYGSKGIYPKWVGEKSVCRGPETCTLLREGILFYPPDRQIWLPVLDSKVWDSLKEQFVRVSDLTILDQVASHIKEIQQKWGI